MDHIFFRHADGCVTYVRKRCTGCTIGQAGGGSVMQCWCIMFHGMSVLVFINKLGLSSQF